MDSALSVLCFRYEQDSGPTAAARTPVLILLSPLRSFTIGMKKVFIPKSPTSTNLKMSHLCQQA